MASSDIRSIVDWLVDGARSTVQAHQMVTELCNRLVGCGIPLWRVAVFVRTLHPQSEATLTLERFVHAHWLPHMRRVEMSLRSISRPEPR
jgi:hypothetical protein